MSMPSENVTVPWAGVNVVGIDHEGTVETCFAGVQPFRA